MRGVTLKAVRRRKGEFLSDWIRRCGINWAKQGRLAMAAEAYSLARFVERGAGLEEK